MLQCSLPPSNAETKSSVWLYMLLLILQGLWGGSRKGGVWEENSKSREQTIVSQNYLIVTNDSSELQGINPGGEIYLNNFCSLEKRKEKNGGE